MTTYIALLRGINVSGKKIIKMDHLKSVFGEMGFENVSTYIQSGNIVFESKEQDEAQLEKRIEQEIERVYSFQVPVIVRTSHQMQLAADQCPFKSTDLKEGEKVYISFLNKKPSEEAVQGFEAFKSNVDDIHIADREVYILSRIGYGKSLFSNNFLENKLKVSATTRNWASVNKLIDMAGANH